MCDWIGNSRPVAAKHYLQVTDEHFARAIGDQFEAAVHAAQNAAQRKDRKRPEAVPAADERSVVSSGSSSDSPESSGHFT